MDNRVAAHAQTAVCQHNRSDDWHQLRKSHLAAAARRNAINRFYSGSELQRLLHPRAPAQHSLALYTDIPDTIIVTGNRDNGALAVFKDGLGSDTRQVDTLEGTFCSISSIKPLTCTASSRSLSREDLDQK